MKQGARFAHISDLHLGRSAETDANAARLCGVLLDSGIDQVIATGDLTHRGLRRELELFESTFAPLFAQGRMVVVPQRVFVSPRRWQKTGPIRQTLSNWALTALAAAGVPPDSLARYYPAVR